jgi:hypothetical protein
MDNLTLTDEVVICYLCVGGCKTVFNGPFSVINACPNCVYLYLDYEVSPTGSLTKIFREQMP